jgi:hypothetical protein
MSKVFYKIMNEVVIGEDNRHLKLKVSLYIDDKKPRQNEETVNHFVNCIIYKLVW